MPRAGWRIGLARALSVLGHPALLVPVAVVVAAWLRGASPAVVAVGAAASVGVAVAVGVYSVVQVRAGRWAHADASNPHERRQLNRFLLPVLWGGALWLWWTGQPPAVVAGLAAGGIVVAVAHALRRWLKVSLHVAFAVFAGTLPWPVWPVVAVGLLMAVVVAWSRLVLQRHTRPEVVVGATLGAVAGIGLQWVGR